MLFRVRKVKKFVAMKISAAEFKGHIASWFRVTRQMEQNTSPEERKDGRTDRLIVGSL